MQDTESDGDVEDRMSVYQQRLRRLITCLFACVMLAIFSAIIATASLRWSQSRTQIDMLDDTQASLEERIRLFGLNPSEWEESSSQRQALDWIAVDALTTGPDSLTDKGFFQKFIMLTLWFSTRGIYWFEGGLTVSRNECDWVVTGCTSGHLQHLDLTQNGLVGVLPSELGLLTNLTSIKLGSNALFGTIPSSLGQLTRLQTLDLSNNYFEGTLPYFGNLTNLKTLRLYRNHITGVIPDNICGMSPFVVDCHNVSCGCCSCQFENAFE